MTLHEYEVRRQAAFQSAMAGLAMDPRFGMFIEVLREYREAAIDNLTQKDVIGSERASLACIGEAAAYKAIISIYDDFRKRGAPE
jgi:hypothetical protein